jgi:hypothetical protein
LSGPLPNIRKHFLVQFLRKILTENLLEIELSRGNTQWFLALGKERF